MKKEVSFKGSDFADVNDQLLNLKNNMKTNVEQDTSLVEISEKKDKTSPRIRTAKNTTTIEQEVNEPSTLDTMYSELVHNGDNSNKKIIKRKYTPSRAYDRLIDKKDDEEMKILENATENFVVKHAEKEGVEISVDYAAQVLKNNKIKQVVVAGEKVSIPGYKEKIQGARPDLDAYIASYLLNNFNARTLEETYTENARTSILRKDGSEKNKTEIKLEESVKDIYQKDKFNNEDDKIENQEGLTVYVDAGGQWLKFKQNGEVKTLYIDHHGRGRGETTSGTKMMMETMEKAGILKEIPPWFQKVIDFTNDIDNLSYIERKDSKGNNIFTESYFRNEWPNSLYALAEKQIPFKTLIKLCEPDLTTDPVTDPLITDLTKPFTEEQLNGKLGNFKVGEKTIRDLCKEQMAEVDETLTGIKNAIDHNKKEGLNFETKELGKIIYHDYFRLNGHSNMILDHLAIKATIAKGFDTFVSWNKDKKYKKFFINSIDSEILGEIADRLNEADPGCASEVRGKFIFGKINNLTEEQFLDIINPIILKDSLKKKGFEAKRREALEKEFFDDIRKYRAEKERLDTLLPKLHADLEISLAKDKEAYEAALVEEEKINKEKSDAWIDEYFKEDAKTEGRETEPKIYTEIQKNNSIEKEKLEPVKEEKEKIPPVINTLQEKPNQNNEIKKIFKPEDLTKIGTEFETMGGLHGKVNGEYKEKGLFNVFKPTMVEVIITDKNGRESVFHYKKNQLKKEFKKGNIKILKSK